MLIQLSSGRGPNECELAVGLFLAVLKAELEACEILAKVDGRFHGCYKSVLLRSDQSVTDLHGTIQWICKSPYRPKQKRKNWFIGVKLIPEPEEFLYETGKGDIVFQTFRSGGNGGQHVNKTESAVRAIHVPTGLTVISMEERSQFQNKKTALDRLKKLLEHTEDELYFTAEEELNRNHNTLERGNPIRTYEGITFRRI